MPLPAGGDVSWPPAQLAAITPKLREWSAWYSGDTEELSDVYLGKRDATRPSERSAQYRGGVVGKMARWFWGQPTPLGQQRTKLHVPVAADIATASSDLLYAEDLTLDFGGTEKTAVTRFTDLLDTVDFSTLLAETGEVAAALGSGWLRVKWDEDLAPHPLPSTVHNDAAWPEFRHGMLTGVTFWQVVERRDHVVRRFLERHERGRIEYGLYEGTPEKLGRRIPLTEATMSSDLTVDANSGVDTGFPDGLTAQHLPNVRPQRRWRNDPVGAHLGRSDFDQQEPLMDALDESWTSWMRDLRLARARLLVPAYMLESYGPGQGAGFDLDQEVFTSLNVPPTDEGTNLITPQQFDIRHEAHSATCQELLEQILRGAGYGPGLFGMAGDTAMTATEVDSRDSRTGLTREKKTRYASRPIQAFLIALSAVDAAKFGGRRLDEVRVEFPASSEPSLSSVATSVDLLNRAEAVSVETKVRMVHPDWEAEQVDAEVQAILAEKGMAVRDLGPLPGDDPDGEQVPPGAAQ